MKPDSLKSDLKKRLHLYGLSRYVDWETSQFRVSFDKSTLTAEFVVIDSAWLGAVMEIVKERCKQLEQKFEPVSIQSFFYPVWNLGRLQRIRNTADDSESGVPLRSAIRYLAILKSGAAQISALVDVQCNDKEQPKDEMVRQFLRYRLSTQSDDVWNPQSEPLLLVGWDVVRHYAAMFKERTKTEKAHTGKMKPKRV